MNGRQLSKKKKPDENARIHSNRKEVQQVKLIVPANQKVSRSSASQTFNSQENRTPDTPVIDKRRAIGKQVAEPADKPKNVAVKRKTDDGQQNSATKDAKRKRIKRRRFKIGCEHVDFVAELGYKQYIQLAISNVFRYLSDKDLTAAFCVSKQWGYVLNQNAGLNRRRLQYTEKQIEMRRKLGTVSVCQNESETLTQSI